VNRELLQAAVRILEQAMHGSVARGTHARAEHLATVARGMELKLAIITHGANPGNPETLVGDAGMKRGVDAYAAHLRREKGELERTRAEAEGRLREYEAAGKGMGEIARRYGELMAEREEVREEIERLKEAD
jgi:diphthamide biosynthesis protein 3